jgi:hypothetical protein
LFEAAKRFDFDASDYQGRVHAHAKAASALARVEERTNATSGVTVAVTKILVGEQAGADTNQRLVEPEQSSGQPTVADGHRDRCGNPLHSRIWNPESRSWRRSVLNVNSLVWVRSRTPVCR